jgi:hypothetical protein
MTHPPRSLRHEYDLFIEQEIEAYKDTVPRSLLLRLGDDAVAALAAQPQLTLTEVVLSAEVDRIIRQRLGLPSYRAWCRRRLKALQEFRRPEWWGLRPDGGVARAVPIAVDGHVLVAGTSEVGPAVFLAANGCVVTAIETAEEVLERVMHAAVEVGIADRVRGFVGPLADWAPDAPLKAVICAGEAFTGLSGSERAEMLAQLRHATTRGGLHVLQRRSALGEAPSLDELAAWYDGWQISVESGGDAVATFLAAKPE